MSFKNQVYIACRDLLNARIQELHKALLELTAGADNDSKSSVGDKHETARAMMQLEFEKISNQLAEVELQLEALLKIDMNIQHTSVTLGSFVKTDKVYLFLSIGLGKITVDGKSVVVLSPQSPLGLKLHGLKQNDSAELNGNSYFIEQVS